MKLYSYVVARDYGFAPNPFSGICTLATCKPGIRRHADKGDLILGTGPAEHSLTGRIVYIMRVTETLSFGEYWNDFRYKMKRPVLTSLKRSYGDNIYHQDPASNRWIQENSHHSREDGSLNPNNVINDTKVDRVLLSSDFAYWGGTGPVVPENFRDWDGLDICATRGYKSPMFPSELVQEFSNWYDLLDEKGYISDPLMFTKCHNNKLVRC